MLCLVVLRFFSVRRVLAFLHLLLLSACTSVTPPGTAALDHGAAVGSGRTPVAAVRSDKPAAEDTAQIPALVSPVAFSSASVSEPEPPVSESPVPGLTAPVSEGSGVPTDSSGGFSNGSDQLLVAGADAASVDAGTDTNATPVLYSVIADGVPVKEILRTLARDSQTQVSFVGDVAGEITLSITSQPLEFILEQISRQAQVRYEVYGDHILLLEDKAVVRTYEVDYLNMLRKSESRVDLATQIGSMTTSIDADAGSQAGSNGSRLFVENSSENSLWNSISRSISGILKEQSDADMGSDNVFINRESGIISVRAREAEHRAIQTMLDQVIGSAHRQVLIEATVVEVTLSDQFESGVDWQVLNRNNDGTDTGFDFSQILTGQPRAADASAPVTALLSYGSPRSVLGNLTATLKLLQQFGDVQVLSSPKIIAMNNQPAVLKVVDNRVYFTFEVDRLERENGDQRTVVDSTVHSVPVGLVMNVTPYISKNREVILNVRPTISRILNFAEDPSPALAGQSQVRNLIPEIQVREMESLLRVQSGNVAIIGGLMQNKIDNRSAGVPGLKRLPLFGKLFLHEQRTVEKTELLVFLRPTVVDAASHRSGLSSPQK